MKKIKKIAGIVLVVMLLLIGVNSIFATKMPMDPDYDSSNLTNPDIKTKADSYMGTFVFLVQVACVVTMVFMGLRYMLTSAEGKADIKKGIVVWCVGAVFVFSATTIVGLVLNVVVGDKQYVDITPNEKSDPVDETSEWASDYWEKAMSEGLVPSSIDDTPRAKISRVEFAETIYLLAEKYGVKLESPNDSIDVIDKGITGGERKKILQLYNAGIINGTGKDFEGNITFDPAADITREDVATILYRTLQLSGKIDRTITVTNTDKSADKYADVSEWAKDAMIYMNKAGIIKGDENGNLDPKGNTTCEQAITIVWRIYSGEE